MYTDKGNKSEGLLSRSGTLNGRLWVATGVSRMAIHTLYSIEFQRGGLFYLPTFQ